MFNSSKGVIAKGMLPLIEESCENNDNSDDGEEKIGRLDRDCGQNVISPTSGGCEGWVVWGSQDILFGCWRASLLRRPSGEWIFNLPWSDYIYQKCFVLCLGLLLVRLPERGADDGAQVKEREHF